MFLTTHYTIAAEIGRQCREQIAASIAASRRRRRHGRRWRWGPAFPRRPASTTAPTAAATSRSAATT